MHLCTVARNQYNYTHILFCTSPLCFRCVSQVHQSYIGMLQRLLRHRCPTNDDDPWDDSGNSFDDKIGKIAGGLNDVRELASILKTIAV